MSMTFEIFAGDFVRLVLNKDNKTSVQLGHGVKTIYAPMVIEGFLMEEDDDFYFLGHDPELICMAISKSQVVLIESADPNEELAHELNEAVPTPVDDIGVN